MKKLMTALFGTLVAGLLNANVAVEKRADADAARETKIGAINSVTENSPLHFSQCQQAGQSFVRWHGSHRSHSSHYSHRSSY